MSLPLKYDAVLALAGLEGGTFHQNSDSARTGVLVKSGLAEGGRFGRFSEGGNLPASQNHLSRVVVSISPTPMSIRLDPWSSRISSRECGTVGGLARWVVANLGILASNGWKRPLPRQETYEILGS